MIKDWLAGKKNWYSAFHKKKNISENGEIFTPFEVIEEMLNQIPEHAWANPRFMFIEPSSGTGNFLLMALDKRVHQYGIDIEVALNTMIGMEINRETLSMSKDSLFQFACWSYLKIRNLQAFSGGEDAYAFKQLEARARFAAIINNNIIHVKDSVTYMRARMPGWRYMFNTPKGEEGKGLTRTKTQRINVVKYNMLKIKSRKKKAIFHEYHD